MLIFYIILSIILLPIIAIPIRTEKETTKLPYLTMGLILINLILWFFTNKIVVQERMALNEINTRMLVIEQDYIQDLRKQEPDFFTSNSSLHLHDRFYKEVVLKSINGRYNEWTALYSELKTGIQNTFFHKFGFVPIHFSLIKMLTYMFLHANFLHVFFNMLFLWIVGCNLEDDWGWWGFLIVYVFSGITACGLHMLKFSQSSVPLVGASGAIAGIMGIFAVRYYKTKIKVLYIWLARLRRPLGTVMLYAGFILPFWFLQQVVGAKWAAESGTAYWAHIGGFIFGAMIAGSLKLIGLEEFQSPVSQAVRPLFQIDPKIPLVRQVKTALQTDPMNVQRQLFYARIFASRGQEKNAAVLYNLATDLILKSGDSNMLFSAYQDISGKGLLDRLSEKNLFYLAVGLEKNGRYQEAVDMYFLYSNRFPTGKAREKSLYRSYVLLRDRIQNEVHAEKALVYLKGEYPNSRFLSLQSKIPSASPGTETPSQGEPFGGLFVPA